MNVGKQIPASSQSLHWNRFPSWSELDVFLAASDLPHDGSSLKSSRRWLFWQLPDRSTHVGAFLKVPQNRSIDHSATECVPSRLSKDWSLVNLDWANPSSGSTGSASPPVSKEDCFSVFLAVHEISGKIWISIDLRDWNVIASLLGQFGYPPYPVVLDWKNQAAAESTVMSPPLADVPLSHLLVAADGRLVSLARITQLVADHLAAVPNPPMKLDSDDASRPSVSPIVRRQVKPLSVLPLAVNELVDAAKKAVLIEDEFTRMSLRSIWALGRASQGINSSVDSTATHNPVQDETFVKASSNDLGDIGDLSPSTKTVLVNKDSSNGIVGRNRKSSKSKAKISQKTLGIGIAAGLIVSLGGYFLFSPNSNSSTLSHATKKSDSLALSTDELPKAESAIANEPVSKNSKQKALAEVDTLQVESEPSQDELIVDVPGVTALDADMPLAQSPEELMSSLSSSLTANKGDGVPSETDDVAAFLKLLQEPTNPVSQEKQSAEAKMSNPGSPFDDAKEPGKEGSEMDMVEEDVPEKEDASEGDDLPIDEKEKANKLVLEEKWKLENIPFKASYKVPFVTADKTSVCRVRLRLGDDMLVKPMEPVVIMGRKDVSWTVALEDDAASLHLFLRSKPGRTWVVLAAMRLKLEDGSEIPIVPGQTAHQRRQLEEFLLNLEQQREVLDNLRFSRRQRNMVMQLKPVVEQKRKEIEKSIKLWEKIDELVNAFFLSHELEMTFASREEFLPVVAESDGS